MKSNCQFIRIKGTGQCGIQVLRVRWELVVLVWLLGDNGEQKDQGDPRNWKEVLQSHCADVLFRKGVSNRSEREVSFKEYFIDQEYALPVEQKLGYNSRGLIQCDK